MTEFEPKEDPEKLHRMLDDFIKRWSPEPDPYNRHSFEADLFMLVRAIHEDAARPYRRTVEKMMGAMPLMPAIIKKDQG